MPSVISSVNERNEEARSILRRIFLCEERMISGKQKLSDRESNIEELLRDNARLVVRLDAANVESKRLDKVHELYRAKMTNHSREVTEKERTSSSIYDELKNQQSVVNELKEKMKDLGIDEAETTRSASTLHADLNEEKEAQRTTSSEIQNVGEQLQKEKEKQEGLRRDLEVLTKRNAAQMIRLKHQIQELSRRNARWKDEEARISNSVAQMWNVIQ